jgi:hypothetical protein
MRQGQQVGDANEELEIGPFGANARSTLNESLAGRGATTIEFAARFGILFAP